MNIAIWHCYHYGQFDTYVMLAETARAFGSQGPRSDSRRLVS
jgi:hypothetical protein